MSGPFRVGYTMANGPETVLSVRRSAMGRWVRCDGDGRRFPSAMKAAAFASERGYVARDKGLERRSR